MTKVTKMRVREYREDVGAPAYRQILTVLNQVNEKRTSQGKDPISYRACLEAMGLGDQFSGKIKSGVYVPTMERLEMLADFLGVHPTVFDTYVKRYATSVISEDRMLDTFRAMARLDPHQQEVLRGALDAYADEVVSRMRGRRVTVGCA